MAASVVQTKAGTAGFSGASSIVTFDAAPAVGRLIIIAASCTSSDAALSTPAGFTVAFSWADALRPKAIYYKVATDTTATFEVAQTGSITSTQSCEAWEVAGLSSPIVADRSSAAETAGTAATSLATGSTGALAAADGFAVAMFGARGSHGGSPTVDSGFTLRDTASHVRLIVADKVTATTTALNVTFGWLTAINGAAGVVVFRSTAAPVALVWHRLNAAGTWVPTELNRI